MSSLLKKVETEEVVIYVHQVYSPEVLGRCREIHKELVEEGKLEGEFDSDVWMGYSGIKRFGLNLAMNDTLYNQHVGKEFGIKIDDMKNMLRCYVVCCIGTYIYQTIAINKIAVVKDFLHKYKDEDLKFSSIEINTVEEFLGFINTPDQQIEEIILNIRRVKTKAKEQRSLSPFVNYLVIENEINDIYKGNCDDETFKRWFPIFFWVNITFILPLRATEMLVTPKECILRENNETFLIIKRTKLKKRKRTVYYDVDKDYKTIKYKVPDNFVVKIIEKYIEITDSQERNYLFEYNEKMVNKMLSLSALNNLIAEFVNERIIGNSKYDFVKFASEISEFEAVTAGDSRHIALSNLYFQKNGQDICRQLADHVNIDTTSGYYSNISNTLWYSSVVRLQNKVNRDFNYFEKIKNETKVVELDESICLSPKQLADEENIEDCIAEGHLESCFGCRYYYPTRDELNNFLIEQKKNIDDSAKRVIDFMNNAFKMKNEEITLEELFLMAQTNAAHYQMGCDIKAKETLKEWEKSKNIQKMNC